MHQIMKGITIMNAQILTAGTDRNYAAALEWIKQTAASAPYSARCPDCDNPTGAAAEARKLLRSWAE